ncbi:MAG TPA: molybdopterin molybdenumtransferase MoeA [Nitrospirae bacterium]|nr:molybdopterin molybdenumtransferase MoeA [Nitrospirota bacterium]HDK82416.1 molybdopterin molybdenumtransferase MoeA [Nitrospirota bacterium]HDO25665.1 molybdopterin molybdenumtransferase MoeA [Nitrospirota bacterium]
MLGREEVLSVEEARKLLMESASVVPAECRIDITDSLNRILSRDIVSPEDLPGFSRSTMDGYAVSASDTFGAKEGMPSYLNIAGEVFMGEHPDFEIQKGGAAKIATGGMLPANADAVVMFEQTSSVNTDMIEVLKPVAPGENIIRSGEDCKTGDVILRKGGRIRPQDVGALAGIGIAKLWAYEKPKVAIIATGDEVVPAERPLKPGQVRDINSYSLSCLIEENGGIALRQGIFKDRFETLMKAVEDSLGEADLVAITGGSSVGTKDLTAKVINTAGKPGVLFHGVSVKPGKPMIGAVINGKPVFGLPGHPAAIIVTFELFIKPVLKLLTGETDRLIHKIKRTVKAKLLKNISSSSGREDHIRVSLEEIDNELWAVPVLGKSGLITTLVKADGTIVIPLRKPGMEKGTEVEVELF